VYRMLKLTCYIPSSRCTMRCCLWRSTFFLTVRTSGYRKTDCIRVNCDVYGNTSGIEEGRQALPTLSKNFKRVATCFITFFYIFFVTSLYVRLYNTYVYTYIHTYIYTYMHTYVYTYIRKYICLYVGLYIRLRDVHTYIRVHVLQRKGKEIHNKYINVFLFKKFFCNHQLYIFNTFYNAQFLICCPHCIVLATSRVVKDSMFS